MKKLAMVTLVVIFGLFLCVGFAHAQAGVYLEVETCWSKPHFQYGMRLGPHIDLVINGSIQTSPDGVWTILWKSGSAEPLVLSYQGPSSIYSGHVYHGTITGIRGGVWEIEKNTTYVVEVRRAPYDIFFEPWLAGTQVALLEFTTPKSACEKCW